MIMKKEFGKCMIIILILTATMTNVQVISGQDVKGKASPLPEDINKILQYSCSPCHWKGGKWMAKNMVNYSKWTEYDAAKQAKKAGMICYALSKDKMPPKKARKTAPDIVPTKEQIELICKWKDSLEAKVKKP